jgi:hypothetical protein
VPENDATALLNELHELGLIEYVRDYLPEAPTL